MSYVAALALCAALTSLITMMAGPAAAQTLTVDFSRRAGPPLVKDKFGAYQTPFWFKSHPPATHDLSGLLREAGVHDLRYEMGWGKPDTYADDQIGGTPAALRMDFGALDPFVAQMKQAGVRPLFAMTYDPLPLRTGAGWQRWKDVPSDLNAWAEVNRRYAAHYRRSEGIRGACYEMWNEPDLPGDGGKVFFNGGPREYGEVYRAGARGIRAGADDALVGGPAIAYDTRYVTQSGILLNQPMDFLSVHAYANYPAQVAAAEAALGGRATPIFLTEYSSYTVFGPDGPNSRFPAAAAFFEDVKGLLAYSRVRKVYWAQWIDDSLGMLTEGLHRRALFNAYKIYQTLLPVDRASVSPDGSGSVNALAASDRSRAGVVVWNNGGGAATVTLDLRRLPVTAGTVRLSRIDAAHASYGDHTASENLTVDDRWGFSKGATRWSGDIPGHGVVFLSVSRSAEGRT